MNINRLNQVADAIKTGYELMDSKWQNTEAEVFAMQTMSASRNNYREHGDAFSWLGVTATIGNWQRGLQMLIDDGSIVQEDYVGSLEANEANERTATRNGVPQILRVTDKLLDYCFSFLKLS